LLLVVVIVVLDVRQRTRAIIQEYGRMMNAAAAMAAVRCFIVKVV
jgi:hypothetical protein